ncbi:MAG: hypothetical protein DDT19_02538 [Syntrophomonadaceae bacterium]|nr:hypothetical protein [Bacillota bacterium]
MKSKKPYTKRKRIADKERLMLDEEVFTPEELAARKSSIRKILFALDAQLRRDQEEIKKNGFCPMCHRLHSTSKKCTNPDCPSATCTLSEVY